MRRNFSAIPQKGFAFSADESAAIRSATIDLYKRSLFHLVKPNFELPSLVKTYHDMIPDEVWAHLARAETLMVRPTNHWNFFEFEETIIISGVLSKPVDPVAIEVTSERLLPQWSAITPQGYFPVVLCKYATAAMECRRKWMNVLKVADILNRTYKRNTVAYHWPCVTALLKIGGQPREDLTTTKRWNPLVANHVASVRDCNAFVMQHSLLPPIDDDKYAEYEGDAKEGPAVKLIIKNGAGNDIFGQAIWPLNK